MFKKELIQDSKALGGMPIYLLTTFAFYLADYKDAALILIVGLVVGWSSIPIVEIRV